MDPTADLMAEADSIVARDLAAAKKRSAISRDTVPRAVRAHLDTTDRRIVIELTDGSVLRFPAEWVQGLAAAATVADEAVAEVEIIGQGIGLHWERLDADLRVQDVLAGRFGTRAWMERLQKDTGFPPRPEYLDASAMAPSLAPQRSDVEMESVMVGRNRR